MLWFIFAFLSAIFYAFNFVLLKKFLKGINQHVFAFANYFLIAIILFLFSFFKGLPVLGPKFYLAVCSTVLLNILITIFSYKSLKSTDLSLSVPMMSFTPLFLIFTSFLLLGELPSWLGICGIILIVIGSYVLGISKKEKNLFAPFFNLLKNKGQLLMLGSAFVCSIAINFDKMAVLNSDWIFSSAVVYFLLAVSFFIISVLKKQEIKGVVKKNFGKFFLFSICAVFTVIFVNLAYTMQFVSYVISVKRLGVLLSVVFGALFFKEKNIPQRFVAVIIMLLGVMIIAFA